MFSHVMVGVKDLEASRKFYDAVLGTLGIGPGVANKNRYFYRSPTGMFGITTPINGMPRAAMSAIFAAPRARTSVRSFATCRRTEIRRSRMPVPAAAAR